MADFQDIHDKNIEHDKKKTALSTKNHTSFEQGNNWSITFWNDSLRSSKYITTAPRKKEKESYW